VRLAQGGYPIRRQCGAWFPFEGVFVVVERECCAVFVSLAEEVEVPRAAEAALGKDRDTDTSIMQGLDRLAGDSAFR
jgi:hypothetical protein